MSTPISVARPKMKLHPANYYEATIDSVGETENRYYKPEEDPPECKNQLDFRFAFIDADGQPATLSAYVTPVLSKNSKFTKLCRVFIPGFDPYDESFNLTIEDFIGKKCRINVTVKPNAKGDETNRIEDFQPLLSPQSNAAQGQPSPSTDQAAQDSAIPPQMEEQVPPPTSE